MEQHGHAILDLNEVNTEQGGDAPAAVLAGEVAGAEEGEPERVTETDNSVRAAATEGSTKQDHEVSDGDSVRCATRKTQSEDRETFENTMVTQFGKTSNRSTIAMHLAMTRFQASSSVLKS
jgi:hypothetical protein